MFQTLMKVRVTDMLKWLQICFLIGDIPQEVRTGYEIRELPSMSWRALWRLLLRLQDASKGPASTTFCKVNIVGWYSMILWYDPWYAADKTSTHQPGWKKKAAQRWATHHQLKWRSSLVRHATLLHKQLIHPVMVDYTFPIWRTNACSAVCKLQLLQSK